MDKSEVTLSWPDLTFGPLNLLNYPRSNTMNQSDVMVAAYMEAAIFTDCGDTGQPPVLPFSQRAKWQAWKVCHDFILTNSDLIQGHYQQAGYDLWLTRNHHGAGFWDKPEVWGASADVLTRCAQVLGEVSVYEDELGRELNFG
jgi:hypothetical protein